MKNSLVEGNKQSRRMFVKSFFGALLAVPALSLVTKAKQSQGRRKHRDGVPLCGRSHVPPIVIGKGSLMVYTTTSGLPENTLGAVNPKRPY